jgi:hypothetical protein
MPDVPAQLDIASQKSVCAFHSRWPSGPRPPDPCVKMARTQMPFGWPGAAQVCVEYYNRMKASLLSWVRDVLSNFIDNFSDVGTTTFARFLEGWTSS